MTDETIIKAEAETIESLCRQYKVTRQTFRKWMKPFLNELNLIEGVRVFTPAQVELIYSKLGRP